MITFKTFLNEKGPGLWANIHKKRKSGRPMRKKGEKGAPTAAAMKSAKGENVNEASEWDIFFKLVDKLPSKGQASIYKFVIKTGLSYNAAMKRFFESNEGTGKKETWEDGYKRRVVQTTSPEHKEKGFNWRIKGKDRDEVTIKLYKSKPDFKEYTKQMKRVAGHEFGG